MHYVCSRKLIKESEGQSARGALGRPAPAAPALPQRHARLVRCRLVTRGLGHVRQIPGRHMRGARMRDGAPAEARDPVRSVLVLLEFLYTIAVFLGYLF
jgi:hypothetical protein